MVESEFERLEKAITTMVERFSRLKEQRNDLAVRLERSEKRVVDLRRRVEELSNQKNQARWRLDGLISRLEKYNLGG
jgi:septal ring factor EnvC (AmiA/AmiB activator)